MKTFWLFFALLWLAGAACRPVLADDVSTSTAPAAGEKEKKDELLRARKAIEAALAADPGNTQLLLHVGFIDHKLGDLESAQSAFEKVAAGDPSETSASYMLALIYEKKGLADKAVEAWKSCQTYSKDPNVLGIASKHLKELKSAKTKG